MIVSTPTLRDILEDPQLHLRVVTRFSAPDLALTGFALSELPDPTAYWDEPGTMLLTTGVFLDGASQTEVRDYVARLIAGGVIGLGISIGPHVLSAVPPRLLAEGDAQGLTIFEVPLRTRFIGVTQAVVDLTSRAKYEARLRALAVQRDFSRAALLPDGAAVIVSKLAQAFNGSAALLTPDGEVLERSEVLANGAAALIRTEIAEIAPRGLHITATIALSEGLSAAIYPVGLDGRPRAYLAVTFHGKLDEADRGTIAAALSILTLQIQRGSGETTLRRRARRRRLTALLRGEHSHVELLTEVAALPEFAHAGHDVVAIVATAPRDVTELIDELDTHASLAGCESAVLSGRLVVFVPVPRADRAIEDLRSVGMRIGVSAPVAFVDAQAAYDSAVRAHTTARALGKDVLHASAALGTPVQSLIPQQVLAAWAEEGIQELREALGASRAEDAIAALAAYLRANGTVAPAATELGIHRHTLRAQLTQVEQMIGASLDDPDTRASLWLALRTLSLA